MVVTFEILQRGAGEYLAVDSDFGGEAGQAEGLAQLVDRAVFAVCDRTSGPQCAVLPSSVAVGLPQDPDWILELFGALDEPETVRAAKPEQRTIGDLFGDQVAGVVDKL